MISDVNIWLPKSSNIVTMKVCMYILKLVSFLYTKRIQKSMPFLSELHTGKIKDALSAIFDKRDTLNPVLITNAHRLGEMGFQILNQIQTQLNFDIICECQLFFFLFLEKVLCSKTVCCCRYDSR